MSGEPVSCLVIVVEAHRRMNNVIEEIVKYAKVFKPKEFQSIITACVTHMDQVGANWTEHEFRRAFEQQTGLTKLVFSQPNKSSQQLEDDILAVCHRPPVEISINSDNFLRFFKIEDQILKVMSSVSREVQNFEKMKREFYEEYPIFKNPNVTAATLDPFDLDMLFEFQAWMTENIATAQQRVAEENGFTFIGDSMVNEAGHIANLTNQLKIALLDVRVTCLRFTQQMDDVMRRCPNCGLVWVKIDGCDNTTCGTPVDMVRRKDDDELKMMLHTGPE